MEAENEDARSKLFARSKRIHAEIAENLNNSSYMRQESECLQRETERLKSAAAEKLNLIANLETPLVHLSKRLAIHDAPWNSAIIRTLTANLSRDANALNRKDEVLLGLYAELEDNLSMNSLSGDKECRLLEIELKKLKVKEMVLRESFKNIKKSRRHFNNIQWKRLQNTIIRFAEIYVLHVKNQKASLIGEELKKKTKPLLIRLVMIRMIHLIKQQRRLRKTLQDKTKL